MLHRRVCPRPHRDGVGNDRNLSLEIDTPLGFATDRRGRRIEHSMALIHQRIGPEAVRHLSPARLAHQLYVIDVG